MARKEAIFKMKVESEEAVKDVRKLDQDMTHLKDTIGVDVPRSLSLMEDKLYDLAIAGEQNTKEFKDLQAQTAKYRKIIIETDRSIDQLAEQGRGLSTALSLAEVTVSGFQAYTGVTALLGDENEELLETITKLQAAQGVLNGIMVIREQLQKNAIKLSQAQAAVQKILNTVMNDNPIGLIITAIAALIAGITALIMNFEAITNWLGLTDDAAETLHQNELRRYEVERKAREEKLKGMEKEHQRLKDDGNFELRLMAAQGKSKDELREKDEALRKQTIKNNYVRGLEIQAINDILIAETKLKKLRDEITSEELTEANAAIEANNEKIRTINAENRALREETKIKEATNVRETEEEKERIRKEFSEKRKAARIAEMDEEAKKEREHQQFLQDLTKWEKDRDDKRKKDADDHIKRMQDVSAEIEAFTQKELDNEEKVRDAQRKAAEEKAALDEKERATRVANADMALQLTSDSIGAISGLYAQLAGNNEAAQRKVFNVNKAVSIAQAIVSTSQGIMAQLAVPQDALTGANFVKAGIVAVTGATQIAKIASTKFNSGGGGGGSASGPSLRGASAGSFSVGQNNNNQNTTNLNPDGTINNSSNGVTKVIVTETDITNVQNKVAKTQMLATF